MHPCRTALIGLLLFGLARSQESPIEARLVNSHLYAQGDIPETKGETPYWWMNKGSPFKRSYSPASALTDNRGYQNNNPFLNGNSIGGDSFLNGGKPFEAAASDNSYSASQSGSAYAAPGYLPPQQDVQTISCSQGQVCVTKYLCRNGFVESSLTTGSKQVNVFTFQSFLYSKNKTNVHKIPCIKCYINIMSKDSAIFFCCVCIHKIHEYSHMIKISATFTTMSSQSSTSSKEWKKII